MTTIKTHLEFELELPEGLTLEQFLETPLDWLNELNPIYLGADGYEVEPA